MAGVAGSPTATVEVASYWLPLKCQPEDDKPEELNDRAWIEPVLEKNAVWFCRLRWVVIAVLGVAATAGLSPAGLQGVGLAISPALPLIAAFLLAGLNLAFVRWTHRGRLLGLAVTVRSLLWAQIVTDLLVLTAVIYWIGGAVPAAPFTYLFHIVLACMVFSPRASFGVAGLAAAFYLTSLLPGAFGFLPRMSVVVGSGPGPDGRPETIPAFQILPMLLIWAVIWYLVSRLAQTLRSRDRALFLANLQLSASVEERSRHMLQTTHQLKAPFAAIHAQAQLLLGEYCGVLSPEARSVTEKIAGRCAILARQIQEMLQLANLRSQGQKTPPRRDIAFAPLLEDVLQRLEPSARQRGLRIEKDIQPVVVHGVEDHLTMLVENLLVNAVNYSHDNGELKLACRQEGPGCVAFSVRDYGIGIPREKLPRIFDDYYRTEEAVLHNRASTGLGLAIVRQVACEDSTPILVESASGWGTRFTVTLHGSPSGCESSSRDP